MCVMQARKHGPLGKSERGRGRQREPMNSSRERRGIKRGRRIMKSEGAHKKLGG